MLLAEIKAKMFAAMKEGDVIAKEILRVAVGEITTEMARPGRKGDDEETVAILKKLIKSNEETKANATDATQRSTLDREIEVLSAFVPKGLGVDEITHALSAVSDPIRAAGNEGQATGIAMKELKAKGSIVSGKDVAAAVKAIRS